VRACPGLRLSLSFSLYMYFLVFVSFTLTLFTHLHPLPLQVRAEDHAYLNRIGIFRVLQTVLDGARADSAAAGGSRPSPGRADAAGSSAGDSNAMLPSLQLETARLTRQATSALALQVVYSLASQVAYSDPDSTHVHSRNLAPSRSLQRMQSGPDTLSRSLFDTLYNELYVSLSLCLHRSLSHSLTHSPTHSFQLQLPLSLYAGMWAFAGCCGEATFPTLERGRTWRGIALPSPPRPWQLGPAVGKGTARATRLAGSVSRWPLRFPVVEA